MNSILFGGLLILIMILVRSQITRRKTINGMTDIFLKQHEDERDTPMSEDERNHLRKIFVDKLKQMYDADPKKAVQQLAYLREHPEIMED